MVKQDSVRLDRVFQALADPTRREMLRRLASGEATVSELAEPFDMSLAGASKHVRVLEGAGLLERRVEGRRHVCRLDARALAEADEWLRTYERFWMTRLAALERELARDEEESS